MVVNAGNTAEDLAWLREQARGFDVQIDDQTNARACSRCKGQRAHAVLQTLVRTSTCAHHRLLQVRVRHGRGIPQTRLSRTGYTGEDGFEMYVPQRALRARVEGRTRAGRDAGVRPIGLGARDTLRLEAGMPLYGHEIDAAHNPIEAGLEFGVSFKDEKGDWIGRAALAAVKAAPRQRLVGLTSDGPRVPRQGHKLFVGDRRRRSPGLRWVCSAHARRASSCRSSRRKPAAAGASDRAATTSFPLRLVGRHAGPSKVQRQRHRRPRRWTRATSRARPSPGRCEVIESNVRALPFFSRSSWPRAVTSGVIQKVRRRCQVVRRSPQGARIPGDLGRSPNRSNAAGGGGAPEICSEISARADLLDLNPLARAFGPVRRTRPSAPSPNSSPSASRTRASRVDAERSGLHTRGVRTPLNPLRAADAAVFVAAAVGLAVATLGSCAPRAPRRPNVLLVTIDTLRADRLSSYGYARATTPNLDRLASEGLRYTHAQAPRAKTTPSIASVMSGLYPHEHGVRDLAQPLSRSVPTLAEALARAGYATGAIVGNWVLTDARAGLARGFELWCETLPDVNAVPPDGAPERKATSLTDGALAALGLADAPPDGAGPARGSLARGDERPWMLWLHYMDPHGAYEAPVEHRVFASDAPDPIALEDVTPHPLHRHRVAVYNAPAQTRLADGRIDASAVRDRYDAEVRYVDAQVGRLLDALRASGELEHTLVIVTSDHGESLGEHRYWFEHGVYAYEATCRVPLIVRPPGGCAPQARAVDVSLVDLAPSLLRWLDVAPLSPSHALHAGPGAWLLDPAARIDGLVRPVYCEKVEGADLAGAVQIKAVRVGDWKLIQRYAARRAADGGAGGIALLSEELYELASDPGETRNQIDAPPAQAPLVTLRRSLARFVEADTRLAGLGDLLRRQREGLEQREPDAARILRALGY
jgi:arylsulfatase A-like enzyme/folate-binding Fe-S cluster repair protein YgfZ